MRYIFKILKLFTLLIILGVAFAGLALLVMRTSLPTEGERGKGADTYAKMIQDAVHRKDWAQTGAIRWAFFNRQYLWDLRRGLVRVKVGGDVVLFDIKREREVAKRNGQPLKGEEARRVIDEAYQAWLRDRFILEPTQSLFDEGVNRFLIDANEKNERLFVHYSQGGNTPGDSYEWQVNDKGMPSSVKVWSKELPMLHGVAFELSGWKMLKTGLKISTKRLLGPITLEVRSVNADFSLTQMLGKDSDPFEEIKPDPFDPAPASQPNVGFSAEDERGLF
jgi:hypothetical protein